MDRPANARRALSQPFSLLFILHLTKRLGHTVFGYGHRLRPPPFFLWVVASAGCVASAAYSIHVKAELIPL